MRKIVKDSCVLSENMASPQFSYNPAIFFNIKRWFLNFIVVEKISLTNDIFLPFSPLRYNNFSQKKTQAYTDSISGSKDY